MPTTNQIPSFSQTTTAPGECDLTMAFKRKRFRLPSWPWARDHNVVVVGEQSLHRPPVI